MPSNNPILSANTCKSNCAIDESPFPVNCPKCYSLCSTCTSAKSDSCLTCKNNLKLNSGSCVATCPINTILEGTNCKGTNACATNCKTCGLIPTYCLTCFANWVFDPIKKTCVAVTTGCTAPYYYNSASLSCQKCNAKCVSCQNSANTCIKCSTIYGNPNLDNIVANDCVANCPAKSFANNNNVCINCHSSCLSCNDQLNTACLTCDTSKFIYFLYLWYQ